MTPVVTALWTVVPLASQGPDPSKVKPGWLAFFIVLALGAATVLLWLSFRRQLKKINFPEDGAPADRSAARSADAASDSATDAGRPGSAAKRS